MSLSLTSFRLSPSNHSLFNCHLPTSCRPGFSAEFYNELAARGHVIYPGKLTRDNCFRIGSIGRLYPSDVQALLAAIKDVLTGMGVRLPVRQLKPAAV